ncbi:phosphomannomutase [Thiorhodovibrio frisius]|uniref:Phosphomannomutase n=1 Tax=Thiorhodovibrio frisius TaxID=631362 RepID=H8Z750_9GAMM|nr:phosphomannomutase [Thiorhodovibrio frisius]EIC20849.1 phosphomannomutase [Thiorhodovibrio frisius]WPL21901.1 Phosphoglucosamine mutase [Thiorhodovibrio frisius]
MQIGDLMMTSGVKFGTSGARGRVADMTDAVCYSYASGFLSYLSETGRLETGAPVALAGDYRESTGRILAACAQAVRDAGCEPRYFGRIPAPALATFSFAAGMPSMMVTGSHIPEDRNGIKFNLPAGEILKDDEAGIAHQRVVLPPDLFDEAGSFRAGSPALPAQTDAAREAYQRRFLDFFPRDCLAGLRIGLYEHSTVARDPLFEILSGLGADVTRLGFSATFVPVDTEAIRAEDRDLARDWCAGGDFDALVSADGDGDRPLLADASGRWLRGDVAGILCARALGAAAIATPVSCNTAVDRLGEFSRVYRTRIGSPYVIAGMKTLIDDGHRPVVGYEANGGFLIASCIERQGRLLPALPTRDAAIVAVAVLADAKARGLSLVELCAGLPPRFTDSDRIKDFPVDLSRERLGAFNTSDPSADCQAFAAAFGDVFAPVVAIDHTDGVRATLSNGEILHLRPSGNAPELRAYTEADTPERANEMNRQCMRVLQDWR